MFIGERERANLVMRTGRFFYIFVYIYIYIYICDSHCSFYLFPRINCCTSYGPPGAARGLRANVKPAHLKVKGSFIQLMSSACSTVTGEPQRQRLASRTAEERETRFSRRWAPHRPRRAADSVPATKDDK